MIGPGWELENWDIICGPVWIFVVPWTSKIDKIHSRFVNVSKLIKTMVVAKRYISDKFDPIFTKKKKKKIDPTFPK